MSSSRLATILVCWGSLTAAASPFSGTGHAIDGDSLRVGQTEVRLFGIDAPELRQTCTRQSQAWSCGSAAAGRLAELVNDKVVNCMPVGTDQHGRTVARCTAGGVDLNRSMVALGYALAYRRYSVDYVSAEDSARASKRGIWSGSFERPSDVRNGGEGHDFRPSAVEPRQARPAPVVIRPRSLVQPGGSCAIKGNHSRKGEKIYHLPGMPYYAETRAEEMFCTEAQARAAGYRRSRADRRR